MSNWHLQLLDSDFIGQYFDLHGIMAMAMLDLSKKKLEGIELWKHSTYHRIVIHKYITLTRLATNNITQGEKISGFRLILFLVHLS